MRNIILENIREFVDNQGTLVQEDDFEQVPVHHLTTSDFTINGDVVLYVGREAIFCESKAKYLYENLDLPTLIEISKITQ